MTTVLVILFNEKSLNSDSRINILISLIRSNINSFLWIKEREEREDIYIERERRERKGDWEWERERERERERGNWFICKNKSVVIYFSVIDWSSGRVSFTQLYSNKLCLMFLLLYRVSKKRFIWFFGKNDFFLNCFLILKLVVFIQVIFFTWQKNYRPVNLYKLEEMCKLQGVF